MTWSDIPGDAPTNAAMIKRDGPAAAPAAPESEDPLAAVRDAVNELIESVIDQEPLQIHRLPGICKRRRENVLDEARKLLGARAATAIDAAVMDCIQTGTCVCVTKGLTVEHVPGARWSAR